MDGRGSQSAEPSASPHPSPAAYAQYSSAAHVLPRKPPQLFFAGPASIGGGGGGQARAVHAQIPPLPVHVLQPSPIVWPSTHWHAILVHAQAPLSHVHVLQSIFFWSPFAQAGGGGGGH